MKETTRVVLEADSTILNVLKETDKKEQLVLALVKAFDAAGFTIVNISLERTIEVLYPNE